MARSVLCLAAAAALSWSTDAVRLGDTFPIFTLPECTESGSPPQPEFTSTNHDLVDMTSNVVKYTKQEDDTAARIFQYIVKSDEAEKAYKGMLETFLMLHEKGSSGKYQQEWKEVMLAKEGTDKTEKKFQQVQIAVDGIKDLLQNVDNIQNKTLGRALLWTATVATPPGPNGGKAPLFRELLEADFWPMTWPDKERIDRIKMQRPSLWGADKGRDKGESAAENKHFVNKVIHDMGADIAHDIRDFTEQYDKETAHWCYGHMAAKMGITQSPSEVSLEMNQLVARTVQRAWKHFFKAKVQGPGDSERELSEEENSQLDEKTCTALSSFAGTAVLNWGGDASCNTVAAHFRACNVPLLGGMSGSILEYISFFYSRRKEVLTPASVLGLMATLTAISGHSLSEQVPVVRKFLMLIEEEGDREWVGKFRMFLGIRAPMDLNWGCVATSKEAATNAMPLFIQTMDEYVEYVFGGPSSKASGKK
eukprot:TRINITY_DN16421_c0_g1_i1.p1 TRINITY_DN16421_c0_g1~~TRINITY_DN16421_c0_g1_i1.p1  ORF type:complete len:478 (-),score=85.76 TRINITY_DN16421_c0_g1_i1:190-1623(-)